MSINIQEQFKSLQNCTIVDTNEVAKQLDDFTAESILRWIAHSHIGKVGTTLTDLLEYCKYLDAKISSTRKTLTFWDAFQVKSVAESMQDFIIKFNNLPINTSLIIADQKGFTYNQQEFKYGDLVFKNEEGELSIINSTSLGVYEPSITHTEEGNNYQINFKYTQEQPAVGTLKSYELTNYQSTPENVYSICELNWGDKSWNYKLTAQKYNEQVIYPMWECRYLQGTEQTPVFGDKIYDLISVYYDGTAFVFNTKDSTVPFALFIK